MKYDLDQKVSSHNSNLIPGNSFLISLEVIVFKVLIYFGISNVGFEVKII